MHLAIAKQHVFCRWQNDDGTHFNLEVSGNDGDCSRCDDDYYKRPPRPLTARDIETGRYLRPLTPSEELALFLETRGHCLMDNGRFAEARVAYEQAYALAPNWSPLDSHSWALNNKENKGVHFCKPATGQMRTLVSLSGVQLRYSY